jgi:hypothetical protein
MMMPTQLDTTIEKALENEGKNANAVYAMMLRTFYFVPVTEKKDDEFMPFFIHDEALGISFIFAFDAEEKLENFFAEIDESLETVKIQGYELIKGIGEETYLSLNILSPYYKEFSSEEVLRLKQMVHKIEELRNDAATR